MPFERKLVEASELKVDTDLVPPTDDHYMALLEDCVAGESPLYWALIPPAILVPSFRHFQPETRPQLQNLISVLRSEIRQGNVSPLYTYQQGIWFVVADDYPQYYAAIAEHLDLVPCFILGETNSTDIEDVKQVSAEDVYRVLFGV